MTLLPVEWHILLFADIANFSPELQAMIQQGYLETRFEDYLTAHNGYWDSSSIEGFTERYEKRRGVTITRTRPGLKAPVVVPADNVQAQTPPNDGVTPSDFALEQYTFAPMEFQDGIDIDLIGTHFSIVDRFDHAIKVNVHQGVQTIDILARDTFLAGYATGSARVTTAASTGANVSVHVDDIRGLESVVVQGNVTNSGTVQLVSAANPLIATVYPGGNTTGTFQVEIVGAAADATNSTDFVVLGAGTPGNPVNCRANGVSGTLTIQSLTTALNPGDIIVAQDGPVQYVGSSGKMHWTYLSSSDNMLTSVMLEEAVASLADDATPYAQNRRGQSEGTYVLHGSRTAFATLYRDPDFKQANQTLGLSDIYVNGRVSQYLGVTFLPNTNAPKIPLAGGGYANPLILAGHGALVDAWFEGLEDWAMSEYNPATVNLADGIAQILMPAYSDRMGRHAQLSWLTIRDIVAPTDITRTAVIKTASGSRRSRARVLWIWTPN
jgi:hypothetical protein